MEIPTKISEKDFFSPPAPCNSYSSIDYKTVLGMEALTCNNGEFLIQRNELFPLNHIIYVITKDENYYPLFQILDNSKLEYYGNMTNVIDRSNNYPWPCLSVLCIEHVIKCYNEKLYQPLFVYVIYKYYKYEEGYPFTKEKEYQFYASYDHKLLTKKYSSQFISHVTQK